MATNLRRVKRQYGKSKNANNSKSVSSLCARFDEFIIDDRDERDAISQASQQSQVDELSPNLQVSTPRNHVLSESKISANVSTPSTSSFSQSLLSYLHPLEIAGVSPRRYTTFKEFSTRLDQGDISVKKIGEGSYSAVYALKKKDSMGAPATILKLIPLRPPSSTSKRRRSSRDVRASMGDGEELSMASMTTVVQAASEIRTLTNLQPVPGFVQASAFRVIKGCPDGAFAAAWKTYKEQGGATYHPDPARSGAYRDDQLWVALEMEDAGKDLEAENAWRDMMGNHELGLVLWDIFWGVCGAMARGEEIAEFEHRDLHLANICVSRSATDSFASLTKKDITAYKSVKSIKVGLTEYVPTIIDCTLSRSNVVESSTRSASEITWVNLESEGIFEGKGSMQYDVYRWMRSWVLFKDRQSVGQKEAKPEREEASRDWSAYEPLTNVFWLYFILDAFLQRVKKTRCASKPGCGQSARTDDQKEAETFFKSSAKKAIATLRILHRKLKDEIMGKEKEPVLLSSKLVLQWAIEHEFVDQTDVWG